MSRHDEIQNFVPRTFFSLVATVQSLSGMKVNAEWEGDRIWKEDEARKQVQELKGLREYEVVESKKNMKSKARPEGVNTVCMLKFASSQLGVGP